MRHNKFIIVGLSLVLGFGIGSCKKEGCTDPTAINYNTEAEEDDGSCEYSEESTVEVPDSYVPTFTGSHGALIAVKTVSTTDSPIGPMDTEVGVAVAVFLQNSGTSYIEAGDVTVDGEALTLQDNNSYVFMPGQTNPLGLTFGSVVEWEATGGSWPSFSVSTSRGFSDINEISSGDVSLTDDYTLTSGSVSNADSILYAVYGPNGNEIVIVDGNTSSYTFSDLELSALGEGSGYAQVVGLNYDIQSINGEDHWLINETVRTKQIQISQ